MVRERASMHSRSAAVLTLALATVTGCAGLRPRFLGGTSLGPPVAVPHHAGPMGPFGPREGAPQGKARDTAGEGSERGAAADPNTPMLRLRLATLYVRTGKLDKARGQTEQVIAAEPSNLDAMALYAGIVTAQGKDDDAIAA